MKTTRGDYVESLKRRLGIVRLFGMFGQKDSFAIQQFLKQVEILEGLINNICLSVAPPNKAGGDSDESKTRNKKEN